MSGEEGPVVLLVEDDELNLELADYLLAEGGFRVVPARDAPEARAVAARVRPDIVLMDVNLPGVDGLELARELGSRPGWEDVPVVAVTALAMRGDRERILDAGLSGYIAKPVDVSTFADTVRAHLRSRGGNR
jgi:two-component system cell cycle response regulator DivK